MVRPVTDPWQLNLRVSVQSREAADRLIRLYNLSVAQLFERMIHDSEAWWVEGAFTAEEAKRYQRGEIDFEEAQRIRHRRRAQRRELRGAKTKEKLQRKNEQLKTNVTLLKEAARRLENAWRERDAYKQEVAALVVKAEAAEAARVAADARLRHHLLQQKQPLVAVEQSGGDAA
jgi:hypothetical protein